MEDLGHQISLAGLEANPKDLGSLVNIPFPRTLQAMQSFLGSLNYYSRFIEDFAVYASVLYELREADFHKISRVNGAPKLMPAVGPDDIREGREGNKCDIPPKREIGVDRYPISGDDRDSEGRNRWEKVMIAFTLLKAKIATTSISKHFEPDRPLVIVVYASKWAVSAALVQEYDGVYWPVTS